MSEQFNSTYPALLRKLAELIEENQLITPYTVTDWEVTIHSYDDDAPAQMAAWRRTLGGTWTKGDQDNVILLRQSKIASLPGNPEVILYIGKNACVRKVVGQKEVIVPAVEAQPERVELVDEVVWDCEPVLSAVGS